MAPMPIQPLKALRAWSLSASMSVSVSNFHQYQITVFTRLTTDTAYFLICMGILCFVYLICSIRTNLIFFLIFFTLVPAFALLAASYLQVANGQAALGARLAEAAGAFCFVTCLCGWYIFLAIMLASVDFPLDLPRKLIMLMLKRSALLTICSRRSLKCNQGC
jgi:succinate-acetate transporter protein